MASKKPKKIKHRIRNAAKALPPPRAPVVPRAHVVVEGGAVNELDTPGWQVAKLVGGAVGTALACAYIVRQDWIPPKALTGGVSAVGAALLLGSRDKTVKTVGAGALAAAGGQFALLMLDDAAHAKQAAQIASNVPPAKKPANADMLPPGALEAAYERARRRMALTHQQDAA